MFLLVSLMLLAALIELVAIASFVPFAAVVANPELLRSNIHLREMVRLFALSSNFQALVLLGFAALGVFLLSSLLKAANGWACARYSWLVNEKVSQDLLFRYTHRPYLWFLKNSTSDLTRDVVAETSNLVQYVLMRILLLLSRACTAGFIVAGILLVDPMVAFCTLCISGTAYGALYALIKPTANRLGEERLKMLQKMQRTVSESFSSIKEAKVTIDHRRFLQEHLNLVSRLRQIMVYRHVVGEAPILIAEILAVATMLSIAAYFVLSRGETESVVSLSVLYMAATIRVTPVLQGIYSDLIEIRFYLPVLERIYSELDGPRPAQTVVREIGFERELRLVGVDFAYPDAGKPALQGIDITIPKSGSVALVGPTGGGKTTLADIIAGLLTPTSGRFLVDDLVVGEEEQPGWHLKTGYVPQEIFLCEGPISENVALGVPGEEIDMSRVQQACKAANLHHFIVDELEAGYDTVLGERGISLSGGQRQRISIARALYRDPELLILDEATSALDNATERVVLETITQLSNRKTLLIIAHRLSTVKACDRIYVLAEGRIQGSGTFEQLTQDCGAFRDLL